MIDDLKIIGDHGNDDNSGDHGNDNNSGDHGNDNNGCVYGNDNNGCVQVVQKEEVTAMPMGPPPSRKMTRTPPVYQQVYLV